VPLNHGCSYLRRPHIRHFQVTVPRDAVAHIDQELGAAALRKTNMRADSSTPRRRWRCSPADRPRLRLVGRREPRVGASAGRRERAGDDDDLLLGLARREHAPCA
jgi:hypothetical protein